MPRPLVTTPHFNVSFVLSVSDLTPSIPHAHSFAPAPTPHALNLISVSFFPSFSCLLPRMLRHALPCVSLTLFSTPPCFPHTSPYPRRDSRFHHSIIPSLTITHAHSRFPRPVERPFVLVQCQGCSRIMRSPGDGRQLRGVRRSPAQLRVGRDGADVRGGGATCRLRPPPRGAVVYVCVCVYPSVNQACVSLRVCVFLPVEQSCLRLRLCVSVCKTVLCIRLCSIRMCLSVYACIYL